MVDSNFCLHIKYNFYFENVDFQLVFTVYTVQLAVLIYSYTAAY